MKAPNSRNTLLLLFVVIFSPLSGCFTNSESEFYLNAQPIPQSTPTSPVNLYWTKMWGETGAESGWAVWCDGEYLYAVGETSSFGAGDVDMIVLKMDALGTIIWNRTWGGTEEESGTAIWGDGSDIYVCGTTKSFGKGFGDIALIKWTVNGTQLWNKTWGWSREETGQGVWGVGSNIYTCGTTRSFGAGGIDTVLVKWDKDGTKVWNNTWGNTGDDWGSALWGNSSVIYTTGWTTSYSAGKNDMTLVKWDTGGNPVWYKTWGASENDWGSALASDGVNLYTCGVKNSPGTTGNDLALVKWDPAGNEVWNHTWGGTKSDLGAGIWISGSNIYTSGQTYSYGEGNSDVLVVNWDLAGDENWNVTWGGLDDDLAQVVVANDTSLYALGGTYSFGRGSSDLVAIKWDTTPPLEAPVLSEISPNPDRDGNVSLTWSSVEFASWYRVYRHTSNITEINSSISEVGNATTTSFSDLLLPNGTYYYAVTAVSSKDISDPSNSVGVDVILGNGGFPIEWVWYITGGLGVIVAILAITILLRRRKKEQFVENLEKEFETWGSSDKKE